MPEKRILINRSATYHCMTRTVNGECLFANREKEILRKMIWQVADFSGVDVLTYCIMPNHFHVLVRVPVVESVPDKELMRRYRVLYPKPTKYKEASIALLEKTLRAGGEDAVAIRAQLMARMGDVSQFMKTLKQRYSIWFNKTHDRFGTLWAERFKSVLVEGQGNPLQTMAAYIDLNPVRKGFVEDPKDYRFSGYAEAVAGNRRARAGLLAVWRDWMGTKDTNSTNEAMHSHRRLLFGKGASPWTHNGQLLDRQRAVQVLEKENGALPPSVMLRCRVRYFTDGAILGSAEFVRSFATEWQQKKGRKRAPRAYAMKGTGWGDLAVIQGLRSKIYD